MIRSRVKSTHYFILLQLTVLHPNVSHVSYHLTVNQMTGNTSGSPQYMIPAREWSVS